MDLRLDAKHDALVEALANTPGAARDKPFETIAQLALFAGVLGYVNQEREDGAKNGRYVPVSALHAAGGESYAYLFSLLESGDVNSLREENTAAIYNLFTDYVNGGFNVLHELLVEGSVDPVENILKVLEEKALMAVAGENESDSGNDPVVEIDL